MAALMSAAPSSAGFVEAAVVGARVGALCGMGVLVGGGTGVGVGGGNGVAVGTGVEVGMGVAVGEGEGVGTCSADCPQAVRRISSAGTIKKRFARIGI